MVSLTVLVRPERAAEAAQKSTYGSNDVESRQPSRRLPDDLERDQEVSLVSGTLRKDERQANLGLLTWPSDKPAGRNGYL